MGEIILFSLTQIRRLPLLAFLVIIGFSQALYSQTQNTVTNCYCEIGAYPQDQQKFFRIGCQIWLGEQENCQIKKIVPQFYNYLNEWNYSRTTKLHIGFVGHWSNSDETMNYLDEQIFPMLRQNINHIEIDNTACKALDRPYEVQNHINRERLPANVTLKLKGHQVNSVGKWDKLIGNSFNLDAMVSTIHGQPAFSSCKYFEGKSCLHTVQLNDSGLCLNQNQKLKKLTCCKRLVDSGNGEDMTPQEKYLWSERCD